MLWNIFAGIFLQGYFGLMIFLQGCFGLGIFCRGTDTLHILTVE